MSSKEGVSDCDVSISEPDNCCTHVKQPMNAREKYNIYTEKAIEKMALEMEDLIYKMKHLKL